MTLVPIYFIYFYVSLLVRLNKRERFSHQSNCVKITSDKHLSLFGQTARDKEKRIMTEFYWLKHFSLSLTVRINKLECLFQ
jgi:hypothetical protein